MNPGAVAVLVDGLFFDDAIAVWKDVAEAIRWPEDLEEGGEALAALFDDGKEGFVLHGGDDLVGRVVTAYWRRTDLGVRPLSLWPLQAGESLLAADQSAAVEPRRAARLLKGRKVKWRRRNVGTLKVTSSTECACWYGFSFGAGWIYRAFEARMCARGGAGNFVTAWSRLATNTWRTDEGQPMALRVAVDHSPRKAGGGSMIATTLGRSYFGLGEGGDRARLWSGLATAKLVRRALTPDLLDRSSGRGSSFESVHLDSPEGWVLDGRLHAAGESGMVQVAPGPTVSLFEPDTGVGAAFRGLLGSSAR